MLNKLLASASIATLMVCTSFSVLNSKDAPDITYIKFKGPLIDVQYSKQGLLCNGIYKNKYKVDFVRMRDLNLKKVHALDNFIINNNLWSMSSTYKHKGTVLSVSEYTFIFNRERDNEYKIISYCNCYNVKLDSLMIYLNDIIPENKKKYYDLRNLRFKSQADDCVSR